MPEFLTELWRGITTPVAQSDDKIIWGTALAALVVVLAPGLWPRARHLVTVLHEGGHGIIALLTGRKLTGIRLHSDTSGLTTSRGKPRGLGMILTLLAGYPAATAAGIGGAFALDHGLPLVVLWAMLAIFALMLLKIRNFFGLWVILVLGVGIFALNWWGAAEYQQIGAYLLTWFLLLAAPRPVLEMAQQRRGRAKTSDADQLGRLTWIPALGWVVVFLALTGGGLVWGFRLLAPL